MKLEYGQEEIVKSEIDSVLGLIQEDGGFRCISTNPIKIGAHQIVYALRVLGCAPESEAMRAGYKVLDQHRLENGRYVLTASKSVPAFKAGNIGEENKWVTLYAYIARE